MGLITISLEPTFEVRDRCGLSTATRKMIQKIWPVKLPKMDPEMLARLVFCFENNPERHDGIISGAFPHHQQSLLHVGLCPWHPGGVESTFPGVVPYQQDDVGPDAGCCLWCLLSDGIVCRMDYPEVGLQEGCDNRSGSLRHRCPDVHTGKQNQQFLLLRSVAVCDRMRTDLSGNECDSSTMLRRVFILRSRLPVCISPLAEWVCSLSAGWLVVSS